MNKTQEENFSILEKKGIHVITGESLSININEYINVNDSITYMFPETYMHPNNQIIIAESIVIRQKNNDESIIVFTHSPYIVEAIDLYSKKHNIADLCKLYEADIDNGMILEEKDIYLIYDKLSKALCTLDKEMSKLADAYGDDN